MRRQRSTILFLFFLILAQAVAVCAKSQVRSGQKGVLVIHANRIDAPSSVQAERIFRTVLSQKFGGNVDYYSEYIDVARFPEESYQTALRQFLETKYEDHRIDLLIGTSPTANDFITRFRSELFPDAAVVFATSSSYAPEDKSTGIKVPINMKGTLDLALKLQPDTKHVFIVGGASEFDKFYTDLAKSQLLGFDDRVDITYLTELNLADLTQRVAHLPDRSIVYFLVLTEDMSGNRYTATETIEKVALATNVPMYCWLEAGLDRGAVGGSVQSADLIATAVAELSLRILRGENPKNIPVVEINPNVVRVDWRQLQRWELSESRLPPGTVVLFKQPTIWQLYKWRILAVGVVLLLQTLLILMLFTGRIRLRSAEKDSDEKRHVAQRLAARVLMLQDEEQKRVAAELHDGLGQSLAIIKNRALMASRALPDAPRTEEQLKEIASTATSAIGEVRQIAHNLRPYELDRLGLVAAIESMIEKVSDASSIDISKNLELMSGILSSEAETSIYRIVQEALNNVVNHSGATEARVEIEQQGKQLAIRVQDNGKGIPTNPPSSNGNRSAGFGLAGIAERVRALGGTFVIDSAAGKGTRLNISLELG